MASLISFFFFSMFSLTVSGNSSSVPSFLVLGDFVVESTPISAPSVVAVASSTYPSGFDLILVFLVVSFLLLSMIYLILSNLDLQSEVPNLFMKNSMAFLIFSLTLPKFSLAVSKAA